MSVYKSKFQPVMERWSLVLKIVLLTTGLMFLLRTFMLQSLQDQIASLLLGTILVSIHMHADSDSFIYLFGKGSTRYKRVFGKKCIPYSCIKNVFVYDGVQNDVRYFGSNGFLGVYRCNGQYPLWEILFLCKESQSTNFYINRKKELSLKL